MTRVMLIGCGDLGSRVLDHLVRHRTGHTEVLVAARDPQRARDQFNTARFTAWQLGYETAQMNLIQLDLFDEARAAELIHGWRPDVIFAAVTLQSWWVIGELPHPLYQRLNEAEVGPWLPMHLCLVRHLMRAVRASGSTAAVINASFPDVVHPVLHKVGLAPTIGIGNVANNIPALTLAASEHLALPPADVEVRLVMHHFASHRLSRTGDTGGAPYRISVSTGGQDVTSQALVAEMFARLPADLRRIRGKAGQAMTAASAFRVLHSFLGDTGRLLHAPGPEGLPGGYPVRVNGRRPQLDLPQGVTPEEACEVNSMSHRLEGIAGIDADGTVTFVDEHASILRELLGYDCPRLSLAECDEAAEELGMKYRELRERVKGSLAV